MAAIPSKAKLTTYSGDVGDFMEMPLDDLLDAVATGDLATTIGQVFDMDQIVEAHRWMETGKASCKIVVLTPFGRSEDQEVARA